VGVGDEEDGNDGGIAQQTFAQLRDAAADPFLKVHIDMEAADAPDAILALESPVVMRAVLQCTQHIVTGMVTLRFGAAGVDFEHYNVGGTCLVKVHMHVGATLALAPGLACATMHVNADALRRVFGTIKAYQVLVVVVLRGGNILRVVLSTSTGGVIQHDISAMQRLDNDVVEPVDLGKLPPGFICRASVDVWRDAFASVTIDASGGSSGSGSGSGSGNSNSGGGGGGGGAKFVSLDLYDVVPTAAEVAARGVGGAGAGAGAGVGTASATNMPVMCISSSTQDFHVIQSTMTFSAITTADVTGGLGRGGSTPPLPSFAAASSSLTASANNALGAPRTLCTNERYKQVAALLVPLNPLLPFIKSLNESLHLLLGVCVITPRGAGERFDGGAVVARVNFDDDGSYAAAMVSTWCNEV